MSKADIGDQEILLTFLLGKCSEQNQTEQWPALQ